jgi:hypothetical protein
VRQLNRLATMSTLPTQSSQNIVWHSGILQYYYSLATYMYTHCPALHFAIQIQRFKLQLSSINIYDQTNIKPQSQQMPASYLHILRVNNSNDITQPRHSFIEMLSVKRSSHSVWHLRLRLDGLLSHAPPQLRHTYRTKPHITRCRHKYPFRFLRQSLALTLFWLCNELYKKPCLMRRVVVARQNTRIRVIGR